MRAVPVLAALLALAALPLAARSASAAEIGRIGLDIKGNDIVVEALDDPKVKGVTCHISRFDRGTIDRLMGGNWFENPSNYSIACRQTGPIALGDIDQDADGEVVFSQRESLVMKHVRIRRIYDRPHHTLIYVAYSTEITESSAKNSISTVSLYNAEVPPPPAK